MSIDFFNKILIIFIFFTTPIFTVENSYPAETAHTQAFLQELVEQNDKFVGEFNKQGYQEALSKQTPPLTPLMCIDDLHKEYKQGNGRFLVVNANNQKDPAILKTNPALSGLKHGTFLPDAK